MSAGAEVPFKISFEKNKNVGRATLKYINFDIVNLQRNECSPRPVTTKDGVLEVKGFDVNQKQWELTILPKDLWEVWRTGAGCEMQRTAHSNNWLALWHTFHLKEQTLENSLIKGYVITDWQRGQGSILVKKRYNRSMLKHGIKLFEKTQLKVVHTPK